MFQKIYRFIKWTGAILIGLLVVLYVLNQGFKHKYCGFDKLYKDSVQSIILYRFEPDSINYCRCNDSLILTRSQIKWFVRKWNNSYTVGPCKYIPKYTLTVRLKDSKVRYFNINGTTIKEPMSYGFKFINGNNYYEAIWTKK